MEADPAQRWSNDSLITRSCSACSSGWQDWAVLSSSFGLLVPYTVSTRIAPHAIDASPQEKAKIYHYYCFFFDSNLATIFWTVSAKPASQKYPPVSKNLPTQCFSSKGAASGVSYSTIMVNKS